MATDFPNELADLCVKCGMCAPHCPTYALDQIEPESPRGRIAMMAAIAQGSIEASPEGRLHLDHCLGCQACEAVCPAKVPYIDLLDAYRALDGVNSGVPDRFIRSLVSLDLLRPILRWKLKAFALIRPLLLRLLRPLGANTMLRLASLAPQHTAWKQPPRRPRPDLQLFVGCLGDLANAAAMTSFLKVCRALQLRVDVIPAAQCCGALSQHRGDQAATAKAATKLSRSLRTDLPIVGMDSACVLQLRAQGYTEAVDICEFLSQQNLAALRLQPLTASVLLHQPCSHRNGLREPDAARKLLSAALPDLRLVDTSNPQCCGAAGLHMLDFPQRADALLKSKLDDSLGTDYVVSTNVGCALHIAAGLRRADLQAAASSPKVCHPVELIAQAL